MASVEFSDSYRVASIGYPDNYIRINYSEIEYDAINNRTKVRLDGVYVKSDITSANSRCYGTLKFNGATVLTMNGDPYTVRVESSYSYISNSSNGATIWVNHNNSGAATLTISLEGGSRNDDNQLVFGALYLYGTGYPILGVRTPESKSVALTSHVSTLTINPNGGIWEGSSSQQSFSQAPTSTKTLSIPIKEGYTFDGWTLTGGGSINGNIYTYGGSNGVLTAKWVINTYIVTCEDRVNNSSGEILGTSTATFNYGDTVSGSNFGDNGSFNFYYTGYYYTSSSTDIVTGDITVYRYFSVNSYILSVSIAQQGVDLIINRTSSPMGGGSVGAITNGAILYYNDVLEISYSIGNSYQLISATINNIDIKDEPLPYVSTVNNNVIISIVVRLGAIVYIGNEAYQAFIGDGTNWIQYQAYIGNGLDWETY